MCIKFYHTVCKYNTFTKMMLKVYRNGSVAPAVTSTSAKSNNTDIDYVITYVSVAEVNRGLTR